MVLVQYEYIVDEEGSYPISALSDTRSSSARAHRLYFGSIYPHGDRPSDRERHDENVDEYDDSPPSRLRSVSV